MLTHNEMGPEELATQMMTIHDWIAGGMPVDKRGMPPPEGCNRDLREAARRLRQLERAEILCEIYFRIANEYITADHIRAKRDEMIATRQPEC